MMLFPTQYSTLAATDLALYLSELYSFGPLDGRLLLRGVSDTYLLTGSSGERYIFKVYRTGHRSPAEIEEEINLLLRLKKEGVSVSFPFADKDGGYLQTFRAAEGCRTGVLFHYAPGENTYDFSDRQLAVLGREMARFHNVAGPEKTIRPVYSEETTLWQPLERIKPAFAGDEAGHAYLMETARMTVDRLGQLKTGLFSYGYCQFDFLPKNFHFEGEDLVTFFDFDFVGQGFQALDLMTFFTHFFFHEAHGKMTKEEGNRQFDVFLGAYREVRALTEDEVAAIPYLFPMFWIFYLGFQYDNRDDCTHALFNARFLRDRVEAVKRFRRMYWDE